jgi:hypothetical protein
MDDTTRVDLQWFQSEYNVIIDEVENDPSLRIGFEAT